MIRKLTWRGAISWLLVAFFVFGGFGNILASEEISADYARWGFPDWFHYLTGIFELCTAGLIALSRYRLYGIGLGAMVMASAVGTVILNGEYTHAIPAGIVLIVIALAAWTTIQTKTVVQEQG